MRTWLKLLLSLALIGAGVATLVYLNRRKAVSNSPTTSAETSPALASKLWAVSDALQQSQLTSLTGQLSDKVSRSDLTDKVQQEVTTQLANQLASKVSRADVADMIQQALASLPTGSNPTPGTDTDLAALFLQQMN